MLDDDVLFRDPNEETKLRWQKDKETLGSSSTHDPPPWNVGDRLNDFVLEELLGVGSSGFVYRVLDAKTNRRCALKLLKHGTPDDLLRNKLGFRRMMLLEHPNLLRVDRIYQLGSYIALSMEEVDGLTLGKAIKQYTQLDPSLAYARLLKLLRDFASGLAMMHANGYIHRDIKPENLMVDSRGDGRVIDYGLVDSFALDQATYSARGFLLGTPHYFSPEVIWSQRYLPAGDIFSLGIVTLDALRTLQRSSAKKTADDDRAASASESVKRSDTNRLDDAERIDEAIQDLSDCVPSTIRNACKEMLDRNPAERPTAMEISRLGLPGAQRIFFAPDPPIVGRVEEQKEVFAWIDGVFSGDIGRVHLTGPSGIGKSRLVKEIIKYIESKTWGQVFSARCRLREDQPLQAFDQLCDAIANRYMQGDRERLELDPVSVEMLQSVFPVLKNILTCSTQLTTSGNTTDRLDALESAARFSEQLRLVGPLFLVIDDSQWADRDSLNVLDRLQSVVGGEGLGIITVSREREDPQRVPASKYIQLQPLDIEESVEILVSSANRWSVELSQGLLRELAERTDRTPFGLIELADEFRPGGALAEMDGCDDSTVNNLGPVDRLWQKRVGRLGDDAKLVLPYVVTAGGRVSTQQLGELTRLDDSVDAAVSELARQRLVSDAATGGECITIFHDHVADELTKTLSKEVKCSAHHAWASLLARQDNPERLAARIAGHFFEAGQPGRAVAHAILAAEDAERLLAKTEAARWYVRVVEHVEGEEKLTQLRNAARCYDEADIPVKAAECYQQLATLVDDDERIEYQLLATTLWIRSGRCEQVRDQLRELAQTLGLPKPSSALRSHLALMMSRIRPRLSGKHAPLSRIVSEDWPHSSEPVQQDQHADCPNKRRQQQAIRFCVSVVRPMFIFDNLYAAELAVAASRLAVKHGDAVQQVHVAVGQAVFGCCDKGDNRMRGEAALLQIKPHVARLGNELATADLWAGNAYSHALACRWDQVSQPVGTSMEHFEAASDSLGFEVAHTRWLDLWATWHLGRWRKMQQISNSMFDDATRRNDLFQLIITTSGFGSAAWLARDKTDELCRIRANAKPDCNSNQTQLFHVFDWIASIHRLLYEGKFPEAWDAYESMEPRLRKTPYSRVQLIRVCRRSLGALVALHNLNEDDSEGWLLRIRVLTYQLRQEQISFARVLANLYEGLLKSQMARLKRSEVAVDDARRLLLDARDEARDHHLRPHRLAAEDALAEIHTGTSLHLLADRMRSQNVVQADRLQRLYTVTMKDS